MLTVVCWRLQALGLMRHAQYQHSLVMSLVRNAVEVIKSCPPAHTFLPGAPTQTGLSDPGMMFGLAFVRGVTDVDGDTAVVRQPPASAGRTDARTGSPAAVAGRDAASDAATFSWGCHITAKYFTPPPLEDAVAVLTLGMSLLSISSSWASAVIPVVLPCVSFQTSGIARVLAITRCILVLYGAVAGSNTGCRTFRAAGGLDAIVKRIDEETGMQEGTAKTCAAMVGADINKWATDWKTAPWSEDVDDVSFTSPDVETPPLPAMTTHRTILVSLLLDTLASGLHPTNAAEEGGSLLRPLDGEEGTGDGAAGGDDDEDADGDSHMRADNDDTDADASSTADARRQARYRRAAARDGGESKAASDPPTPSPSSAITPADPPLSRALKRIFRFPECYDGVLVGNAASLLADIVNADPSCTSSVHKTGLAKAYFSFLRSRRVPANAEPVRVAASVVGALCLTNAAQDAVLAEKGVSIFSYILAMTADPRYGTCGC